MEVSGSVLRRVPCLSGGCTSRRVSVSSFSGNSPTVGFQPKKSRGVTCNGFVDKGHLNYYVEPTRCGVKKEKVAVMDVEKEKKTTKKRMKLLKGLSKNLTMFSTMGFGLDPDSGLVGDVQNKTISEAAEVLLKQIEQLKAEEKREKKRRKEEKAKAKAMKMMNAVMESESSSSSSSESSDSDCDGEVVDMSCFRNKTKPFVESLQRPALQQTAAAVAVLPITENDIDSLVPNNIEGCCTQITGIISAPVFPSMDIPRETEDGSVSSETMEDGLGSCRTVEIEPCLRRRVEVCMGGKCKKSGGAALLGEFERVVMGVEGSVSVSVSACKCMGKCRDGPNVRVVNQSDGLNDDSTRTPSNAVCLGVGIQDVEAIVSSFFGNGEGLGSVQ